MRRGGPTEALCLHVRDLGSCMRVVCKMELLHHLIVW